MMPGTVHTGLPVLFAGSWEVLGQNELSCVVLYIGLVNDTSCVCCKLSSSCSGPRPSHYYSTVVSYSLNESLELYTIQTVLLRECG